MSLTLNHFYNFGEFTVDSDQKVLLRNGIPLPLAPKVFDTLLILVSNSGRIVKKQDLMNQVWPDTFVEEANLTFNIQQLRKTLGDNARKPIYIETIARRGYRFIAHVEVAQADSIKVGSKTEGRFQTPGSQSGIASNGVDSALETGKPQEIESKIPGESLKLESILGRRTAGQLPKIANKTTLTAVAVAVVLMALSSWLLWRREGGQTPPSSGRLMLAVLPFQNLTGDEAQEYFSDGLTEEMIAQVGRLNPEHLGVIARTSVMRYKNTQESLDQIGRELRVQYVLEGSVRRESDRVRITAQLIRVTDQTHVWARQYDHKMVNLLSLQGEIAREVADEILKRLGHHIQIKQVQTPFSPNSYEAYDLYLKGLYHWNKRTPQSLQQAIDYFQQATVKDPNYAQAFAYLANSYALIGGYSGLLQTEFMPKARAAAQRALEIDRSLAEAHTALALIVQNYDWDLQRAEKEFRQALELNPNYATAHHWYAEHLAWRGRFDEALRESERARQLDPLSLIIATDNGAILYFSRQYDAAIQQLRAVLEMEPNFPRAHIVTFAYVEKGMFTEALADIESWRRIDPILNPWQLSMLAYVYGRSGQQVKAKHALEKLQELNRRQPVDAPVFALAYIGTGNNEQALAWLEKAYSQRINILSIVNVDPAFDSLRSDPRFQELQRRVGLAQ